MESSKIEKRGVSQKDFGPMIVKVGETLKNRHYKRLCTFYQFSPADIDHITTGIEALECMVNKNLLSPNNVTTLRNGLEELGLQHAVTILDEFILKDAECKEFAYQQIAKMYCMKLTHNHPTDYNLGKFPDFRINVVLVGKTGNGKSATGNTLLGKPSFKEADDWDSCTKTVELAKYNEKPLMMEVIDTPGLFDPSKGGVRDEDTLTEIAKTALQFSKGVHAFFLICRSDARFTEEEVHTVNKIVEKFGQSIYHFLIVIFTRGKTVTKSGKSLSDRLESSKIKDDFIKKLKEKVCNRVLALENIDCSEDFRNFQQTTLHCAICELLTQNSMKAYTNEILHRVEECRKQEFTKINKQNLITKTVPSFLTKIIRQSSQKELMFMEMKLKIVDRHEKDLIAELNKSGLCTFQKNDFEGQVEEAIKDQIEVIKDHLSLRTQQEEIKEIERHLEIEHKTNENKRNAKSVIRSYLLFNVDTLSIACLQGMLSDPDKHVKEVLNRDDLYEQLQTYSEVVDLLKVATEVILEEEIIFRRHIENKNNNMLEKKQRALNAMKRVFRSNVIDHLKTLTIQQLRKVKEKEVTLDTQKFLTGTDLPEILNEFKSREKSIMDEIFDTSLGLILNEKLQENKTNAQKRLVADLRDKLTDKIYDATIEELQTFKNCDYPNIENLGIHYDKTMFTSLEIDNLIAQCFTEKKETINRLHTKKTNNERKQKKADFIKEMHFTLDKHIEENCLKLSSKKLEKLKTDINNNLKDNELCHILKVSMNKKMQQDLPNDQLSDIEMDAMIKSAIQNYIARINEAKKKCKEKCFPGTAMITKKISGKRPISSVQVGDQVLTATPEGKIVFQEVYLLPHAEAVDEAAYISIKTQTNITINLSCNHCLYIGSMKHYKKADEVKVGDLVFIVKDDTCVPDTVASVKQTYLHGAYCPYTLNGSVVVNGVAASCFTTTISPVTSQILLTPLRALYSITPLPIYRTMFSTSNISYVVDFSRWTKKFLSSFFQAVINLQKFVGKPSNF